MEFGFIKKCRFDSISIDNAIIAAMCSTDKRLTKGDMKVLLYLSINATNHAVIGSALELAKILDIGVATVRRTLKSLEGDKLIRSAKTANRVGSYIINADKTNGYTQIPVKAFMYIKAGISTGGMRVFWSVCREIYGYKHDKGRHLSHSYLMKKIGEQDRRHFNRAFKNFKDNAPFDVSLEVLIRTRGNAEKLEDTTWIVPRYALESKAEFSEEKDIISENNSNNSENNPSNSENITPTDNRTTANVDISTSNVDISGANADIISEEKGILSESIAKTDNSISNPDVNISGANVDITDTETAIFDTETKFFDTETAIFDTETKFFDTETADNRSNSADDEKSSTAKNDTTTPAKNDTTTPAKNDLTTPAKNDRTHYIVKDTDKDFCYRAGRKTDLTNLQANSRPLPDSERNDIFSQLGSEEESNTDEAKAERQKLLDYVAMQGGCKGFELRKQVFQ